MLKLFKQPFPHYNTASAYFRDVAMASLLVALLVSVFQPFGLDDAPEYWPWLSGPCFGMANMVIQSINYLLYLVFPQYFKEDHWTLGKELGWSCYSFLAAAIGNYQLGTHLFPEVGLFQRFDQILLVTIAVGLMPYLLITYVFFNRNLKQKLKITLALNEQLSTLKTPSTNENVTLPPLGEQDDGVPNYLRHYVISHGEVTSYRMRGTLKDQSQLLDQWPILLRTHRAYIINLAHIQQVEGNAAGYRVLLHPALPKFPVSRGHAKSFKHAIEGLDYRSTTTS